MGVKYRAERVDSRHIRYQSRGKDFEDAIDNLLELFDECPEGYRVDRAIVKRRVHKGNQCNITITFTSEDTYT